MGFGPPPDRGCMNIGPEHMGHTLDEVAIKRGLRELNPDLHFDLGAAHNLEHPFIENRQGVFYKGKHIGSLDRGLDGRVPEQSIQIKTKVMRSVPLSEVGSNEVCVPDLLQEGHVKVWRERPWRIVHVGWRDTFEWIIKANVPGVSEAALAEKFSLPITFTTREKQRVLV